MKKLCKITILPADKTFEAYEGDSLYTALLVEGLIDPNKPGSDRLHLDKGSVSEPEDAAAEAAVFTKAELEDDWLLAGERYITGDATFTVSAGDGVEDLGKAPLAKGYGLVVDMGTGNICAGLVDLETVRIPWLTNIVNSQSTLAEDVNARLAYCRGGNDRLKEMSGLLRRDIDAAALKLCHKAGIDPQKVRALALVGNYPMTAIFLEQMPPMGWPPMGSILRRSVNQLGFDRFSPETPAYILPAASPAFGADTIGSMLAANMLAKKDEPEITILVDIGMRGEVVAAGKGRLMATSVPALPFEGAGLSCGMPAHTGAITGVDMGERIVLRTVRDARPKGICGAGMISIVYALLANGMLDSEGHLLQPDDLPDELASRYRGTMGGREFVLSWADKYCPRDICVNQDDIHQVQLAKGAVYAACKALLAAMGAKERDIKEIMLAEASAANIRTDEALAIGLLPRVSPGRVIGIGNAAWQGAYMALSNRTYMNMAIKLAQELESLDLTSDLVYAEEFLDAMNFDTERLYED